jgi:hypothetical protein
MWSNRINHALAVILLSIAAFSGSIPTAQAAPTRSLIDRTDEISGTQIHLVYTLPIGSEDKSWDTNGQIQKWVDQSQEWLFSKTQRKLKYDTYQNLADVSYFQSSLTLAQMRSRYSGSSALKSEQQLLPTLMNEFLLQSPSRNYRDNPKIYVFILGESLSSQSCGFAQYYSAMSMIFAGGNCWRGVIDDDTSIYGMSWPARAIIHEVFHTLGVEHVCDSKSDLMWGKPECEGNLNSAMTELDADYRDYYRGDAAGVDISLLPIWTESSKNSPYGKVRATSTYTNLLNEDYVFTIGERKSIISWGWERIMGLQAGGQMECTLSNGRATISAAVVRDECEFEVPLNWRGGVLATVTGKIWTGPYSGEVTGQVKLLNPDFNFTPCTQSYCFEGITTEIRSNFCYRTDSKSFTLQQYIDSQWKDIATTGTRPRTDCSNTSWEPIPISYNFNKVGAFIFRYVEAGTPISRGFIEPTRTISILARDADYPSTAELKALREAEAKIAAELKAKQEAEAEAKVKAAAELKAKQEAEAKAAAELKAKQEAEKAAAEAKAAAELKAKQEAELKAAAELKAKQEAELKAAAELKAKEEAELKAASELKAQQEAEAAAKAAAELKAKQDAAAKSALIKKVTITCIKGKLTKKITGVKPKCPAGYKVKK